MKQSLFINGTSCYASDLSDTDIRAVHVLLVQVEGRTS